MAKKKDKKKDPAEEVTMSVAKLLERTEEYTTAINAKYYELSQLDHAYQRTKRGEPVEGMHLTFGDVDLGPLPQSMDILHDIPDLIATQINATAQEIEGLWVGLRDTAQLAIDLCVQAREDADEE